MKDILKKIGQYLSTNEIDYVYDKKKDDIAFTIKGELTDYTVYICVPNTKAVIIWAKLPIIMPERVHNKIIGVINEVNGGAIFSFLHLDTKNCTVCSQTSFIFEYKEINKYILMTHISSVVMLLYFNIEKILTSAFGEQNFKEYLERHRNDRVYVH